MAEEGADLEQALRLSARIDLPGLGDLLRGMAPTPIESPPQPETSGREVPGAVEQGSHLSTVLWVTGSEAEGPCRS
jgi:hypothetical protein